MGLGVMNRLRPQQQKPAPQAQASNIGSFREAASKKTRAQAVSLEHHAFLQN